MKQITIYDLLPLMKPGFVVMYPEGFWWWFETKPKVFLWENTWINKNPGSENTSLGAFNIAPFEGDWKDSLIEVGK